MRRIIVACVLVLAGSGGAGCCWGHDCETEPHWVPEPVGGAPAADGQSCEGDYLCPYGLVPVLEGPVGADACVCRFSCVPGDGECPPDRVCVQLEDDTGAAIPGQGACEPEYVAGRGEPCAPQQCAPGDLCAGYGPDTAYCRAQCDPDTQTCGVGYECVAVSEYGSPAVTACLPVTGDAAEGEPCDAVTGCQPGLFCVAISTGAACRPACDPWAPLCAQGTLCLRVPDALMGTLGYACVPTQE